MIRLLTPPLLFIVGALWLIGAAVNLLAGAEAIAFASAWSGVMSVVAGFATSASLRWAAYVRNYLHEPTP